MATLSGEATPSFSILLPFSNGGQLLQEIVGSSVSKLFPLRVDHLLNGLHPPGKQTESDRSYLLLKDG